LNRFWKRQDELERRLRRERPVPPALLVNTLLQQIDATPGRRRSSFRLGLAAAVSVAMLLALGAFGGLGYAASSVRHAVQAAVHVVGPTKKETPDQPVLNSAAQQYGPKVLVCAMTPDGRQVTASISQSVAAAYLQTHPKAYLGSCGAFRPRGAKPNVCVRLANGKFVPAWIRPSAVPAYLRRNFRSHRVVKGHC
jgi:hypothetical protein